MHTPIATKALCALSALLLALSLNACSKEPAADLADHEPTLSQSELPTLTQITLPEDTTEYRALAYAVFENVPAAAAEDFTYEANKDGITLLSYLGQGGVVVLPDTIDGQRVTELGDALFKGNTALQALSIPDSVTRIGEEVLNGCRTLQQLKTPQLGATRDAEGYLAYLFGGLSPQLGAFKVGSSLDTVILTDPATKVDSRAFYSCYRLIMVILPESLGEIGSYAFSGCSNLKYVNLPDSLQSIGMGAFTDCTSLRTMTIPDGVRSIGLGTWMGCTELSYLSLPFVGGSATENRHLGYVFGAQAYTWNQNFIPASLLQVDIRSGDIPNYAFYECTGLFTVTLPADCSAIGVRAFHGCSKLYRMELPDSVTHLGDMAFSDCPSLSVITLGSGLLEIGMQTFMDCINLTEITLPDGITMLPPSLFAGCKRLERVTIGSALTTVDDAVFRHCISLREFHTQSGTTPSASTLSIGRDNDALNAILQP